MTSPITLAIALRHQAEGVYCLEAAAELLIAHQTWLRRADFTSEFIQIGPGLIDKRPMAVVDWPAAITTLQAGYLPCSGGEHRILLIAASLAEGIPVDLSEVLTGLDEANLDLIAATVLHAGGHRPLGRP
jgi:hypothetical protein